MPVNNYQLVVRTGPNPNIIYELTQPVIHIVRVPNNDIAIDELEVSHRHARLTVQPGGYILEDLGSTNGTFVNGQRLIGPHLLRPGELVALGENVLLSFELAQADSGATVVSGAGQTSFQPPELNYPASAGSPAPSAASQGYGAPARPSPMPARPAPTEASTYQAGQPGTASYSGQIPQSPPPYAAPEPAKKSSRTLLFLGIGCLVLFLCVCVGSAIFFDTLNLYCIPPFNSLFNWLYTCPAG